MMLMHDIYCNVGFIDAIIYWSDQVFEYIICRVSRSCIMQEKRRCCIRWLCGNFSGLSAAGWLLWLQLHIFLRISLSNATGQLVVES